MENQTYFEMSIDKDHANRFTKKENQLEMIPQNYFCHFEQDLDPEEQWEVTIVRYLSILKVEEIDIVVTTGGERKSVFSDNYLRQRSYILQSAQDEQTNMTSKMVFTLKQSASKLDIYSRMVGSASSNTFKVIVRVKEQSFSIMQIVYSAVTLICMLTVCCLCVICCSRCMRRTRSEPEWQRRQHAAHGPGQRRGRPQSEDDDDSSYEEFQWDDDPDRALRMRAILRALEAQR